MTDLHPLHISDHYPRFIRETLIERGESPDDIRVMVGVGRPNVYVVQKTVMLTNCGIELYATLTREQYDDHPAATVHMIVEAGWEHGMQNILDWHYGPDEDNDW